jgi:hypothetical protein
MTIGSINNHDSGGDGGSDGDAMPVSLSGARVKQSTNVPRAQANKARVVIEPSATVQLCSIPPLSHSLLLLVVLLLSLALCAHHYHC